METKTYPIIEIKDFKLPGVTFARDNKADLYAETYFEWQPMALCSQFADPNVSGGFLETHYHLPICTEMEYHIDTEVFYFVSGEVIMPFCTLKDGAADMESVCFVRIPAKTQVVIEKGVGHFVAVASNCEKATLVVVSPKMDAPRIALPYRVQGV